MKVKPKKTALGKVAAASTADVSRRICRFILRNVYGRFKGNGD